MRNLQLLAAISVASALLPVTVYTILRYGALVDSELWDGIDPYEVNTQLCDRNDD